MSEVRGWLGSIGLAQYADAFETNDIDMDLLRQIDDQALSLALADLGGICEGIFHTVPDMARNFDTISARPGHESNLMRPYFAAHGRDGVAKGQDCFWIPGRVFRL